MGIRRLLEPIHSPNPPTQTCQRVEGEEDCRGKGEIQVKRSACALGTKHFQWDQLQQFRLVPAWHSGLTSVDLVGSVEGWRHTEGMGTVGVGGEVVVMEKMGNCTHITMETRHAVAHSN